MTTLQLLSDMPDEIESQRDCEAVTFTVLTAPACSLEVRGLEVTYRRENGWRIEELAESKA